MFRIPGCAWQHPADVVPPGSAREGAAMRSPMAHDGGRDVWEASLTIKRRMAPLQVAFDLVLPDMGATLGPLAGGHFVVPVGLAAGVAEPLGPSLVEVTAGDGPEATATLNFAVSGGQARAARAAWAPAAASSNLPQPGAPAARCFAALRCLLLHLVPGVDSLRRAPIPDAPQVFSRHARSMSLCMLRSDGSGFLEVGLDPAVHRSGDVWHVQLQGLRNVGGLCYGWRAGGDRSWAGAHPLLGPGRRAY